MGAYDFSAIEAAAERAEMEGRKVGFRIRAVVSELGLSVPDYPVPLMPKGFWHDYDRDGTDDT